MLPARRSSRRSWSLAGSPASGGPLHTSSPSLGSDYPGRQLTVSRIAALDRPLPETQFSRPSAPGRYREWMGIPKNNLALAGEYRVASELLRRGLHASVTFGNAKAADIFAIGLNRKAAQIEVKTSQQANRVVTGFFQKNWDDPHDRPDFWVLCAFTEKHGTTSESFFVLTHEEMEAAQAERNWPGATLTDGDRSSRARGGVDNVLLLPLSHHENRWDKIVDFCSY